MLQRLRHKRIKEGVGTVIQLSKIKKIKETYENDVMFNTEFVPKRCGH